jgi:hypothetical protein
MINTKRVKQVLYIRLIAIDKAAYSVNNYIIQDINGKL